ncbi:hypothetical protein [Clostridium butyricum]
MREKNKRAVEVTWSLKENGVVISTYDEKLFGEILKDHKGLFDSLFKLV